MRVPLFALALSLALASTAQGEIVHLKDGSTVTGAILVQNADGSLDVMTSKERVTIPWAKVTRVDRTHKVGPKLAKRARKAQIQIAKRVRRRQLNETKKQQREIGRLLDRYGSADDEGRAGIEATLDGYAPSALLSPLGKAIENTKAATRELALRRLSAMKTQKATDTLLGVALTGKKKLAANAHDAALKADGTRTRTVYEAVAASPTKPSRRFRALGYLGAMNQRASTPGLIYALEHVLAEIQAQLATDLPSRNAPVTLSGGATSIPVELPGVQKISIKSKVGIPTLRKVANAAANTLQAVTAQSFGEDVSAWKSWWAKQPEAKPAD